MAKAKLTDQCLWVAHIEDGPIREALCSLHSGSIISLSIDGEVIDFQRMARGKDGRVTNGFNPIGPNVQAWRARYKAGDHQQIDVDFAGRTDA